MTQWKPALNSLAQVNKIGVEKFDFHYYWYYMTGSNVVISLRLSSSINLSRSHLIRQRIGRAVFIRRFEILPIVAVAPQQSKQVVVRKTSSLSDSSSSTTFFSPKLSLWKPLVQFLFKISQLRLSSEAQVANLKIPSMVLLT